MIGYSYPKYPDPAPPVDYDYKEGEWPSDVPREQRDKIWAVRTFVWPLSELEGTQHLLSMPQALQSAFEDLGTCFQQMRAAKEQMRMTAPPRATHHQADMAPLLLAQNQVEELRESFQLLWFSVRSRVLELPPTHFPRDIVRWYDDKWETYIQ